MHPKTKIEKNLHVQIGFGENNNDKKEIEWKEQRQTEGERHSERYKKNEGGIKKGGERKYNVLGGKISRKKNYDMVKKEK